MAKKDRTPAAKPTGAEMSHPVADAETLKRMHMKVAAEGFVPKAAMEAEFGAEMTTRAIALFYRNFRVWREQRATWEGKEVLGYGWADTRFSKADRKKIPPEFGFVLEMEPSVQPRYTDFKLIQVRCRYTNHILGGIPDGPADEAVNRFERVNGDILILRYGLRAMGSQAFPLIGKQPSLARNIRWSAVRINGEKSHVVQHGIVDPRPGSQGKGLRRSEQIDAGMEFIIKAYIPTSELSPVDFVEMLKKAGEFVGLSPARSAGYGDFEVLEVLGD